MAVPRSQDSVRAWLTRHAQAEAVRGRLKQGALLYADLRGAALAAGIGSPRPVRNIYAASPPKAGSQWMKALLDHPIVRQHSGLFTLPQTAYVRQRRRGFPAGTFVPGVYLGYDQFSEIPQHGDYRVIYMFRDPLDLVVSGYFSATRTHRPMKGWEQVKEEMVRMPREEGVTYFIEQFEPRLREMASWVDLADDAVRTFRLEDVSAQPADSIRTILDHCAISLSDAELNSVVQDVSRGSLQQADLSHRKEGSESHYRVDRQTWSDVLTPDQVSAVEAIVPGLRKRLGYPDA